MIVRPRGQLWETVCDTCGASWYGPEGVDCEWCDKRLESKRNSFREQLLFPEWLGWGDRFRECSPIDQTVWAETRGFTGDYRGKWKRELFRAVPEHITAREASDALKRYQRWMTHIGKSDNY